MFQIFMTILNIATTSALVVGLAIIFTVQLKSYSEEQLRKDEEQAQAEKNNTEEKEDEDDEM